MSRHHPTLSLDRAVVAGGIRRPVLIRGGHDGWRTLTPAAAELAPDAFLLVTPTGLPEAHTARLTALLTTLAPVRRLTLTSGAPDPEADRPLVPGTVVVALGGTRVIQHAAGLAARGRRAGHGTRLIVAPSTPSAMTDTALSAAHPSAPGFVPALVWTHLDLLRTLPPDELRPGLAALVRNVLAVSPAFRTSVGDLLRPDRTGYDPRLMARAIALSADIRATLTAYDPDERGPAQALHYGRTVATALLALTGPRPTTDRPLPIARRLPGAGAPTARRRALAHRATAPGPAPAPRLHPGDALALGLLVAARVAVLLGVLTPGAERAHHELLERWGAPRELPAPLTAADVAAVLRRGGASQGAVPAPHSGPARMVLLGDLGRPHVVRGRLLTEVDHDVLTAALEAIEPTTTTAQSAQSAQSAPQASVA
ncbi:hypothetical protein OG562_37480 [Streptomyces sp. NBC_01275]|uniref:hypothetical protein n=1 Tax=Streptomyces sp. NBC_01275 TaxID=2903807 RepID=UPI00224DBC38|nr:hypothetical protein [Streptomyces sp. NBC_01275]MCX4766569.1 hypothetical protein [Streptomyces sp. NBC_01275]